MFLFFQNIVPRPGHSQPPDMFTVPPNATNAAHAIAVSASALTWRKCCPCRVYDRCPSGLQANLSDVRWCREPRDARTRCQEMCNWRRKLRLWELLEVGQNRGNVWRGWRGAEALLEVHRVVENRDCKLCVCCLHRNRRIHDPCRSGL